MGWMMRRKENRWRLNSKTYADALYPTVGQYQADLAAFYGFSYRCHRHRLDLFKDLREPVNFVFRGDFQRLDERYRVLVFG